MTARQRSSVPDDVWHDEFTRDRNQPRRGLLADGRDRLLQQYEVYRTGDRAGLHPSSTEDGVGEALAFCYRDRRSTVGARLLDELVGPDPRCPYCLVNTAHQLDHYAPKSTYAEYAVCASNLVPACSQCNEPRRKGDRYLDVNGKRLFLHPYLDPVPDDGLIADVVVVQGAVVATYRVRPGPDTLLMTRHVAALDLAERYASKASYLIGRRVHTWKLLADRLSPDGVAALFLGDADRAQQEDGPGTWRPALYRGLARCGDVLWGRFADVVQPPSPTL